MKKRGTLFIFLSLLTAFGGNRLRAQYVDLTWDLVGHYPLDGDARDISGYGNHGSIAGAIPAEDRQGMPDRAYYFDGIDDHINCGRALEPVTSAVTVSCRVKVEPGSRACHIVSKYDFTADAGFILGLQDGLVRWAGRIGSGLFIHLNSSTRVDDGNWHHLLGMVDGSSWYLYVDGVLENRLETGFPGTDLNCTAPLTLGMHYYSDNGDHRYFRGVLDDVLIFRRALNPCEMEILNNGNIFVER